MNSLLVNQYELLSGLFIENIAKHIPEEIADLQPEGFSNTIRWNIGHVLFLTEQLVNFPERSADPLPAEYEKLFARGTRPSEWASEPPSLEELAGHLKEQLERFKRIPEERQSQVLQEPVEGMRTFEELASLILVHNSMHVGIIFTMKQVIEHSLEKSAMEA
ncbi:DinB family protein [Paenibacillus aurantius]|uniref:DinB family protein n=1 Tax=Paenibacillus aurantius TaxID=2918900 RepID=A0AA96LD10_9BACL|nr:DinB family protein [Paenibacillus aurantius]WNQ11406.1 DinB family protein [Paenibacillus aurantius]